jgi:hypothetical protein
VAVSTANVLIRASPAPARSWWRVPSIASLRGRASPSCR